jgi:hypothetical protein
MIELLLWVPRGTGRSWLCAIDGVGVGGLDHFFYVGKNKSSLDLVAIAIEVIRGCLKSLDLIPPTPLKRGSKSLSPPF